MGRRSCLRPGSSAPSDLTVPTGGRWASGPGRWWPCTRILRSRIGLALTAIRDDETAARSLGVNVLRTKVLVWTVAALGCGLVGAVIHLNLVASSQRPPTTCSGART